MSKKIIQCEKCTEQTRIEAEANKLITEIDIIKNKIGNKYSYKFAFVFEALNKVQDKIVRNIFEEPKGIFRKVKS